MQCPTFDLKNQLAYKKKTGQRERGGKTIQKDLDIGSDMDFKIIVTNVFKKINDKMENSQKNSDL